LRATAFPIRAVIEEGAIHLHRVAYALDDTKSGLMRKLDEIHATIEQIGQHHDELVERMKVRLGPDHEVTRKFLGANEATLDVYRALGAIRLEETAEEAYVRADVARVIKEQRERIAEARARFDVHRREYIDAAARTAGARLPPS
jgi:hypothetical protein